jgi:hypothetical protein
MVSVLFLNNKTSEDVQSFSLKLENVKQEMVKVVSNNTSYLEQRQNRSDEKQDNYQNTSSNQISLLTQRLDKLEAQGKTNGQKVIQNSIQTINGFPTTSN